MCVCFLMPTHCTITCFGFRTRQIDGVECGLFSIHAPLGRPHYVWDEYLSVAERDSFKSVSLHCTSSKMHIALFSFLIIHWTSKRDDVLCYVLSNSLLWQWDLRNQKVSSSGKALGYRLDGPGSIPGGGGVVIFLYSFVSRLVLGSSQPPVKW